MEYEIKYTKRKTLNISVERDKRIIVRAPDYLTEEKIDKIVQSKRQWIKEKLSHLYNTDNLEIYYALKSFNASKYYNEQ